MENCSLLPRSTRGKVLLLIDNGLGKFRAVLETQGQRIHASESSSYYYNYNYNDNNNNNNDNYYYYYYYHHVLFLCTE